LPRVALRSDVRADDASDSAVEKAQDGRRADVRHAGDRRHAMALGCAAQLF